MAIMSDDDIPVASVSPLSASSDDEDHHQHHRDEARRDSLDGDDDNGARGDGSRSDEHGGTSSSVHEPPAGSPRDDVAHEELRDQLSFMVASGSPNPPASMTPSDGGNTEAATPANTQNFSVVRRM